MLFLRAGVDKRALDGQRKSAVDYAVRRRGGGLERWTLCDAPPSK